MYQFKEKLVELGFVEFKLGLFVRWLLEIV